MPKQDEEIILKDEERQPVEVWSRCMGYHRPVQDYNIGKKQEFKERIYFKQTTAEERLNSNG